MKQVGMVIALVLFLSITTVAQDSASSIGATTDNSPVTNLAMNLPPAFGTATLSPTAAAPASELPSSSGASLPQVAVQSVFPSYNWQAYAGYTFVRFYAYPQREVNRNGFDLGTSYYLHAGHFGVDGAMTGTFGSIANQSSNFFFAGGGVRARMAGPAGTELWAHGLVGDAYFGPRISGFDQQSIGYEVGGGIDINAHLQRFAIRAEGDMISTRLYNTAQYSPKFSVGIVYKF